MRVTAGSRDHYVPKFILRNFGAMLYVFDKQTGESFTASYKAAPAWERDLESDAVEEYLKRIDADSSKSIEHLKLKGNPDAISEDDRAQIAIFAAVEMVRTTKFRDQLQAWLIAHPTDGGAATVGRTAKEPLSEMRDELKQIQARHVFKNALSYAQVFFEMDWSGLHNKTRIPFWTSDNPVVPYDRLYASKEGPNQFLKTPGLQVFFPITPRFQLVMMQRGHYTRVGVKLIKQDKQVLFLNNTQFASSRRFIYSSEDPAKLANWLISEMRKENQET